MGKGKGKGKDNGKGKDTGFGKGKDSGNACMHLPQHEQRVVARLWRGLAGQHLEQ